MHIEDAWVDEPAVRGKLERPRLCVQVDMLPDVTIKPVTFHDDWTVGKYGPFVKYTAPSKTMDAGSFNVRFRNKFPVVVDISLFLTRGDEHWDEYSLPLTRARQLVRKHDPTWRLLLSDKDAQHGEMLWLPQETNSPCKYFIKGAQKICGKRPAAVIRVSNVDLAMCTEHSRSHNDRFATKRAASSR